MAVKNDIMRHLTSRLLITSCYGLIFAAATVAAHAQTVEPEAEITPRAQIVQSLSSLSTTELAPEGMTPDALEPDALDDDAVVDQGRGGEVTSPPKPALKPVPAVDNPQKSTRSTTPSVAAKPSQTAEPFAPVAGRYGFFQTAADYLAARGDAPSAQLKLTYRVTLMDVKTGIPLKPEFAVITLGDDYVMLKRLSADAQIFDFKTRRLLTVSDDAQSFTNVSLFGARYSTIDTVRRMTANGDKRAIDAPSKTRPKGAIGPATPSQTQALNAFYLESALGWAAKKLDDPAFKYTRKEDNIEASFDGDGVFMGRFNGPNFDTRGQSYSFVSLMFHTLPAHPEILSRLTDITRVPTNLTLHKVTPEIPAGQKQIWQLTDAVSKSAPFPLPRAAKSVAEQEGVTPLAFVVSEALKGGALGGPPDPAATLAAMEERLAQGDVLAVWLSAAALSDKLGDCKALSGLCDLRARARAAGKGDEDLAQLFAAFDDVQNPSRRIAGITALQPLLADPDVPGIILRKAGVALSKTRRAERMKAGMADLNPETLLIQSIAKDPYDYAAYLSLAQLYAARGDFIQSWDIADALRAFPDAPDALKVGFDRAESQLLAGAPGFFPPN